MPKTVKNKNSAAKSMHEKQLIKNKCDKFTEQASARKKARKFSYQLSLCCLVSAKAFFAYTGRYADKVQFSLPFFL